MKPNDHIGLSERFDRLIGEMTLGSSALAASKAVEQLDRTIGQAMEESSEDAEISIRNLTGESGPSLPRYVKIRSRDIPPPHTPTGHQQLAARRIENEARIAIEALAAHFGSALHYIGLHKKSGLPLSATIYFHAPAPIGAIEAAATQAAALYDIALEAKNLLDSRTRGGEWVVTGHSYDSMGYTSSFDWTTNAADAADAVGNIRLRMLIGAIKGETGAVAIKVGSIARKISNSETDAAVTDAMMPGSLPEYLSLIEADKPSAAERPLLQGEH